MPLREPAGTARRAVRDPRPVGHVEAVVVAQIDLAQLRADALRERARIATRLVGVLTDAEAEIEAVDLVTELEEQMPERERILAAGDRDEHALAGREHVVLGNRLAHLLAAMVEEALLAERRVVAAHVDDRRLPATTTLHAAPPDTTARSELVS